MTATELEKMREIALRIREMREISGLTQETMAEKVEVTLDAYIRYENGQDDFPFTFIHKCAQVFGIGITDLLEGRSAHLSSYTVTRKGHGLQTAKEDGIAITDLAPMFRKKIAEPYHVKYEYDAELQNKPIHLTKHSGQEFDLVLEGRLKVQVGDNIEYLSEGDSIYYNSSTPHGMIAVDGRDCLFLAVVLPGNDQSENLVRDTLIPARISNRRLISSKFVQCEENENGYPLSVKIENEDKFNFAFDIVDALAKREPDKLAMLHISKDKTERRLTFNDMKRHSNQCANYFKNLGIKKGDRVMLVLKRHYQFWFAILALHKLGAIAIPATNQLQVHDFEYRFQSAGVSAVICTADGDTAHQVEL
ncbi:MAG: AMP-binding protein, partial [Oscillospiraceae bacterium]|nr:AMP-binding protein [Oscillospiraceae bacterium]